MKINSLTKTLPAIGLAVTLALSAVAADNKPMSAEESILTTVTATVQAIDPAKRLVTLKGPLGNTVQFTVDKRVQRLDEIKVGDEVTANYYVSLEAELRAPTAEEKENPVQILDVTARAPKGTEPVGGVLHVIKAVTMVVGLDLPTESVTLKGQGPMGYTATIRAKSVDNLKKLHLGDIVVVTYTEALAVSVEKVKHKQE